MFLLFLLFSLSWSHELRWPFAFRSFASCPLGQIYKEHLVFSGTQVTFFMLSLSAIFFIKRAIHIQLDNESPHFPSIIWFDEQVTLIEHLCLPVSAIKWLSEVNNWLGFFFLLYLLSCLSVLMSQDLAYGMRWLYCNCTQICYTYTLLRFLYACPRFLAAVRNVTCTVLHT